MEKYFPIQEDKHVRQDLTLKLFIDKNNDLMLFKELPELYCNKKVFFEYMCDNKSVFLEYLKSI